MTDHPLSGRRIFVVEDEMMVAMLLEQILSDLGCEIIGPAESVEQAPRILKADGTVDAAVLDVNLKGENSYPIADELVARNVPVVFATGYDRKSLHNGYASFPMLQKPFTDQELGDVLIGLVIPKDVGTSRGG